MMYVFRVLAKLKKLRGTAFDPFGKTAERRLERQILADYEKLLDELASGLSAENYGVACDLAALPMRVRGFGHVKEANIDKVKADEAELLKAFQGAAPVVGAAE